MELLLISALASGLFGFQLPPPEPATTTKATCTEHIVTEPKVSISDWPKKTPAGELNAYVVVEYSLDGSGKAIGATVIDSSNRGIFNELTLRRLSGTEFSPGVRAEKCIYVSTYQKAKRR